MSKRIGIIGAGPAGLSTASLLPGEYDVWIFEEHNRIGFPVHCAGIISFFTAGFYKDLVGEKIFENRYSGAYIYTSKGYFAVIANKPLIYKLNRPLLEEKLYDIVSRKGFNILLSTKVNRLFLKDNMPCLETKSGNYIFDYVVNGEGFSRRISMDLGCPNVDYVYGIQYLVRTENIDPGFFHVIFIDKTPFLPIWIVPIDSNEVLIGYGYRSRPIEYNIVAKIVWKYARIKISSSSKSFGGAIPIGRPCYPIKYGKIFLLGDAIPFTKPFSGGGLYGIAYLTPYLIKSIIRENTTYYHKAFIHRSRMLNIQLITRNISLRLGGLHVAVEYLRKLYRIGFRISLEDYDHHERIFIKSIPLLTITFPLIFLK